METKSCPRCGARWLNGQLYWATGKEGKEIDLAGLVCNRINDPSCINPCNGIEGGDTWERRATQLQLGEIQAQAKLKDAALNG